MRRARLWSVLWLLLIAATLSHQVIPHGHAAFSTEHLKHYSLHQGDHSCTPTCQSGTLGDSDHSTHFDECLTENLSQPSEAQVDLSVQVLLPEAGCFHFSLTERLQGETFVPTRLPFSGLDPSGPRSPRAPPALS